MPVEALKTASGGIELSFSSDTAFCRCFHPAFIGENLDLSLQLALERIKNAENQLKSVTVPGVSVSTFVYDYIGRRVKKSVHFLSGGSSDYSVTYVYSGWNKIQETKAVGSTVTTKNFVWGLDLSQSMEGAGGIGGLLAVVDGSGSANLFSYDGNGNVSELLAADSGNVSAHYEYSAFGASILGSGPLASENCYRFSTKEFDEESGLYDYGYRPYDAELGRWVSRDPIGERGGMNLYGFVGNDAINRIDVLGNAPGEVGLAMMNGHGTPTETRNQNNTFYRIALLGSGNAPSRAFKVNTAEEALVSLATASKASKSCGIKRLTWAGHGWAWRVGRGSPQGPGLPGVAHGSGLYENGYSETNTSIGGRSVDDLREKIGTGAIKFEKPCLIQIHACRISVTFASDLSNATGCSVVAPHAGASPFEGDPRRWSSGPTGEHAGEERRAASDPASGWPTGWYEARPGGRIVERRSRFYEPAY
jgi:RHS repeat-associated protein